MDGSAKGRAVAAADQGWGEARRALT